MVAQVAVDDVQSYAPVFQDRVDRTQPDPIQATRTAAHRSIMETAVITMLPSEACGTTCSR